MRTAVLRAYGRITDRIDIAPDRTALHETAQEGSISHGNGRVRRSLWQCFCLRWNRQGDERCGLCGKPKPAGAAG